MYCSKCGAKVDEHSKFCFECGNPLSVKVTESDGVAEITDKEAAFIYAGEKWEYYFRKWKIDSSGNAKKVSANLFAFLFPYFWAAYRKMYILVFSILLVWLGMYAVVYSQDDYSAGDEAGIALITSIIIGAFGNFLYHKQAKRKIRKIREKTSSDFKEEVEKAGGTSILMLLISIFVFIIYFSFLDSVVYPIFAKESTIEFGYSEDSVGAESDVDFEPFENIYYSFYFSDLKGGEYTIVIEKMKDGTQILYDSWDKEVPPDWEGVTNNFVAPEEKGTYVMKIIKNNKVSAKGTFRLSED